LLLGIVVWELAGRLWHLSYLPPFSRVVIAAIDLVEDGELPGYLAASLVGLALGYGLAATLGVTIGLLMGRYRRVEHLFDLYLYAFLATPNVAMVPILFAFFGASHTVQVAVVFTSAFFIIVANTMSAVRAVDAQHLEMARSFGASERQLFWKVLLPGALPLTMAGLHVGMGKAVKGMINGEILIAVFGLGGLLRFYSSRFDSEKVFAVLLAVICVALVCTTLVQLVGRRLTHWTGGAE
jgi:NitT/TauT family transport system permease protein